VRACGHAGGPFVGGGGCFSGWVLLVVIGASAVITLVEAVCRRSQLQSRGFADKGSSSGSGVQGSGVQGSSSGSGVRGSGVQQWFRGCARGSVGQQGGCRQGGQGVTEQGLL
jgi:hypothetical protein